VPERSAEERKRDEHRDGDSGCDDMRSTGAALGGHSSSRARGTGETKWR
jgi:hypothetical protein